MPVGHAPIHELGKAEDTSLITPHLFKKVSEIDAPDLLQTAVFEQGPKQLPCQDQPVAEGVHGPVFLGPREHFCPPPAKFRVLVDSEISVEIGLRCVEPLEKLPVPLLQLSGSHLLRYNVAIGVVQT